MARPAKPLAALVLLAGLLPACGLDALTRGAEERIEVFDTAWEAIDQDYPYFQRLGLSAEELRAQYRTAAAYAQRPHEFYHLLAGMLSELRDPHVALDVPADNWLEEGVAPTSVFGPGQLRISFVDGEAHVVQWPPGGEPIQLRRWPDALPRLARLEGFPVSLSPVGQLLAKGPPGSWAELELEWPDGQLTRHRLRRPDAGPAVAVGTIQNVRDVRFRGGSAVNRITLEWIGPLAHVRIGSFSVDPTDEAEMAAFTARIDTVLAEAAAAEGLLLDLRGNTGGLTGAMAALVGRFVDDQVVLPASKPSSAFFGLVDVYAHLEVDARAPRYEPPVVVLTGPTTASAAEIAARILQSERGCPVVGERTAGAEAGLEEVRLPDGSLLTYGGIRLVDVRGRGLQIHGVLPDVPVDLTVADLQRLGPDGARTDWDRRALETAVAILEEVVDEGLVP